MEGKEKTVVMFPNLDDRLREKGFDALHNKRFSEALVCFEQLSEHGLEDEQSEFAAIVCLMELHELFEARERCSVLLQRSDMLFFEVLEMYLSVLLQLHDYTAVTEVVQEALRREELSDEEREKLYPLLSFAEKMDKTEVEPRMSSEEQDLAAALEGGSVAQQLQALYKQRQCGRLQALPFVQKFLKEESKHPYVKSILVEVLMDSGVRDEITVTKFGRTISFIPLELPNLRENTFMNDVLLEVDRGTGGQNPTMLQALSEYWHEMMYILFPFSLLPPNASVWAAALEKIGSERFALPAGDEQIAAHYGIAVTDMNEAYVQLLHIEQEGFLPI